jgi:pimeloyl-ACP methyl ester carboxylesterase
VAALYVSEHGADDGRPIVVLVHGSMDRSSAFARVQRHLDDLHVVRYDRRGYGRSVALGPPASFDVQVDDLAEVVAGRPAVLVGHSLGGVVALGLAERSPEVARAVVAYEAPMPWTPWWPGDSAGGRALEASATPEDAAEGFMRRMIGDDRWCRLPARTRAQRRAEGAALLADLRQIRDVAAQPYEPAKVTVPVVAACGSGSSPHHQQTARALADEAPDAELVVVEGARHGIHLTHPADLAALARRALARAAATS